MLYMVFCAVVNIVVEQMVGQTYKARCLCVMQALAQLFLCDAGFGSAVWQVHDIGQLHIFVTSICFFQSSSWCNPGADYAIHMLPRQLC